MSIIQQNFKNWIWAILIIGLANVSRPFSMILPFTLLITIYFFSQIKYKPRYILILLTFLIMLTVFFPSWIHKKIGAPGSELNGNTACVILAITRNSNWKETLIEFETKFSSLSNAERNKLMLHEAFVNFKQHPNTSLQALLKSTKSAYIGFFRNSFSLLIPIHIMDNFMLVFSSLTWIVLIIFSYKYWEQFKLIILLFWIGVFNFFFFAPVVYESGGWRIVASLMIPFTFLFTFLFIGLKLFLDRKKLNTIATYEQGMSEVNLTWIPKFVSILIFISILFMFTTRRYKIGNSDFNFYLNFVETKDQIGWKSFNEASISKEGFNNWLNFVDYCKVDCKPLINYFDVHFTQFDKIIWNKEGYLLIKKSDIYEDLLLPNDSIIHPWAPKFTIKEN
jgi:hypothetical protein